MPTTMAERMAEARRRLTLDMMVEANGQLSDLTIRSLLARMHSPATDVEEVRADMEFFSRHGLITIEKLSQGERLVWVAKFTPAGQAVARGRNHVGIAERDAV